MTADQSARHMLDGLRVIEIADEQAEYAGLVLAGLGAEVIKVEPPGGNSTRRIGPFYEGIEDPERSLFFWHYNRAKRSICLDLEAPHDRETLLRLLGTADVFLESTRRGHLDRLGLAPEVLCERFPSLVIARISPFGDAGPWAGFRGCDLVHLALGGQMMNTGYDPRPDGSYDLAPMAGQMWHSYHIAGENMLIAILGALFHRARGGGGQYLSCAVHEAAAKNTELDLMSWVMRRAPLLRQTCRHAMEFVTPAPSIHQTKDGRWFMMNAGMSARDRDRLIEFLGRYGMAGDLTPPADQAGPGERPTRGGLAAGQSEWATRSAEAIGRLVRKFTYTEFPWQEAQQAGLTCVPLRRPEENVSDEHWRVRGTYAAIEHPEHGRSFLDVTSKWLSSETEWIIGRRAPLPDEDRAAILPAEAAPVEAAPVEAAPAEAPPAEAAPEQAKANAPTARRSPHNKPFALDGIRILDFTWFLASAGGTRFLAAMGAESIKVEWAAYPDTKMMAMAPVGGRAAREAATAPLEGVKDPDMGGQFNNKNPGKRGISLNVAHPKGLAIARRLVPLCDIVAEGFSPGVMERWGLGYDALRELKPDIIYAQQSGMGTKGVYGRFRSGGPTAASLAGTSEMSGLPEPAMPAGWGYSFLDWIGAYSFATAMLAALNYRERTGLGQWIDASQTETGIFIGGTAALDWSAHGQRWQRYGNRSPYLPAAPHGAYRCRGTDRWVAIACFSEEDWATLVKVAGHPEWAADRRFKSLADRLAHQDELDEVVNSWTTDQDCYEVMYELQRQGVAAGVCQTAADRVDTDPQLAALGWLTEVTGTKIGTWPVAETSVKLSETPAYIGGAIDRGAPCYGEDNEYVYGELLGMSTIQIAELAAEGVI
jgi:crotonobetainyl-CoA:carnitine CoA-transferase CaiB-like acyl-CoA transferase